MFSWLFNVTHFEAGCKLIFSAVLKCVFLFFTVHVTSQAVEEEGGSPDEIVVAMESAPKKATITPKRANVTRGTFSSTC